MFVEANPEDFPITSATLGVINAEMLATTVMAISRMMPLPAGLDEVSGYASTQVGAFSTAIAHAIADSHAKNDAVIAMLPELGATYLASDTVGANSINSVDIASLS